MTEQPEGFRPVPWKVSDVVLATIFLLVSIGVILVLAALFISADDIEEQTALTPWFAGLLEGMMLVAVWLFAILRRRAPWQSLGLVFPTVRWSFVLPWAALFGSLVFTAVYSTIVTRLGLTFLEPPPIPPEVIGEGATLFFNALVIGLWGPFAEEVFFRGFMLAALIPVFGPLRAAIVSAIIFAAAHLMIGSFIPVFVTGLLLAWLYIKTRSLWPPVIAHAAQNLIALWVTAAQPLAQG